MLYVLLTLLFVSPKEAKWFEVSSDHFLLFTDTNEMKGRRLLSDLESRVDAFAQAFGKVPPRQFPIEVFLFKDDQDFYQALPRIKADPNVVTVTQQRSGPFGLPPPIIPGGGGGIPGGGIPTGTPVPTGPGGGPGGIPGGSPGTPPGAGAPFPNHTPAEEQLTKAAYMLRGPDRIFIVARDKSPEAIANDVGHALGHALFERYGFWRPFWLAEGAAEYVRNVGRGADTKPISAEDAFSASDMFTIVPSGTYKDDDPPTPFRLESYRLVRLLLESKPEVLRKYIGDLHRESDKSPEFPVAAASLDDQLKAYVETSLKAPPAPTVRSIDADMARLAIHRGDLMVATSRDSEAGQYYNADSKEARAARAVLTRFSRPEIEAVRALERTSRELPDNGLVQYHFGAMTITDKKDIQAQQAALERAVQLLPLMGRAYAELARVDALNGQPDKSMPLIAKALELEPEYADHFYGIRAEVHIALGETREALHDVNVAADLPHADRSIVDTYLKKIADIRKEIENARRALDQKDLDQIQKEVLEKRAELEPPLKPAPPPPPVPEGGISYEIETRAPIEVVDAIYPDYPEALRAKHAAGTIALRVDIGPDGKVKTAAIASSQLSDLNDDTVAAVKKWTFKPGNRSIRLVLNFKLQ